MGYIRAGYPLRHSQIVNLAVGTRVLIILVMRCDLSLENVGG
ncbi:hypothetical protein MSIMFB_04991 [Mycobacterium simulans]|uniref:Uncharacterized protein n=1 Tax=Mycobacterium simulans TaxID=627089 RepID=A0A7Z7IPN1_9MYCO|nr:hypothetical protein MSIMFB_04991 [Mycobacterium simulans]